MSTQSARERLVNGGELLRGWNDDSGGDLGNASRILKQYQNTINSEIIMSNQVLLSVRKDKLKKLLEEEAKLYTDELSLDDKAFYQHRL